MDATERASLRAENAISVVRWAARTFRERGQHEEAEALDAFVARIDRDEPIFDCTDAAHPAWWRGHDYTARRFGDLAKRLRATERERDMLRAALSGAIAKLEAALFPESLARGTPMPPPPVGPAWGTHERVGPVDPAHGWSVTCLCPTCERLRGELAGAP